MAGLRHLTTRLRAVVADPGKISIRFADGAGIAAERVFIPLDRRLMRRNRNLAGIPWRGDRRGGKISYGEWAWVIGVMQSLIATSLPRDTATPRVLDVGCGTGLVGLAALPLLGTQGRCLGLDVMEENIDFCRMHHRDERLSFELLEVNNRTYAPHHPTAPVSWPVPDASQDIVTALSVWTHLDPDTAASSMSEVARVLRPGGRAIITFFIEDGEKPEAFEEVSQYHATRPDDWVFDRAIAPGWSTPSWTTTPEQAIALDDRALETLVLSAGLTIERIHRGYWREKPGLYFQDVAILSKER